jgi:hypothetical protein
MLFLRDVASGLLNWRSLVQHTPGSGIDDSGNTRHRARRQTTRIPTPATPSGKSKQNEHVWLMPDQHTV